MARWLGRKRYRALAEDPLYHALARGLTFTWFAFSLIFFWADWSEVHALRDALGWVGAPALFMAATLALAFSGAVRNSVLSVRRAGEPVVVSRYVRTACTTAMVTITVAATALLNAPAPDIVYKAF
jgi:hypothetical protein